MEITENFKKLISYINKNTSSELKEEDIEKLMTVFKPKKIRKHQFLLQEGETCKWVAFIVKGALRQYTVDENGKEHIVNLFIENWWTGDRESFTNGTPSPFYIDAWEDTELLMLSKTDVLQVLNEMPFMGELSKVLSEKNTFRLIRRVNAAISYTAEQRLADLEKNNPELLQRFPQHIIASFLGMTKETLSRIRSNSIKK